MPLHLHSHSFLPPSLPTQITQHEPRHRLISRTDLLLGLAVSCRLVTETALLVCILVDVLLQHLIETGFALFCHCVQAFLADSGCLDADECFRIAFCYQFWFYYALHHFLLCHC